MDLKGFNGICEKLVPPLVVLHLIDLILGAEFFHRLLLEAFEHDHGFGLTDADIES
jgi:hypothetical protein